MNRPFISPPSKIPLLINLGIWITKKITGKDLLPPKLLSWYPRVAISSGILEALVTHKDKTISERLLKIVRIQTSLITACPFCIDMNSFEYDKFMSDSEFTALQGKADFENITSFSKREKLAIQYARLISQTPLEFPPMFVNDLKANYSEREIVILASTIAQVNYWARLIQAMGVPPAGFTDQCQI